MKTRQKLIEKINIELGLDIDLDSNIKYLKPSINQQARGMFKWVFDTPFAHLNCIGSCKTIKELLKTEKLEWLVNYEII